MRQLIMAVSELDVHLANLVVLLDCTLLLRFRCLPGIVGAGLCVVPRESTRYCRVVASWRSAASSRAFTHGHGSPRSSSPPPGTMTASSGASGALAARYARHVKIRPPRLHVAHSVAKFLKLGRIRMLRFEKGPGKRVAVALVARVAMRSFSGSEAARMRLRLAWWDQIVTSRLLWQTEGITEGQLRFTIRSRS